MLKIQQTLRGHVGRVWHCSWSPQGTHFSSCGEDKTIRIWSIDENLNFGCIAVLEESQFKTVRSCEWSPDGSMIASASFDGTVVVWQRQDKSYRNWDQIACLEGHENEVKCVSWSHDGQFVATCGRDKKIWMWEKMSNGDFECIAMLEGHSQDVKFIRWDSNNVLFSAGYDDLIKMWKEANDEWVCFETLQGHSSTVWGVSISDENTTIVSCSDDKSIRLWNSESLKWSEVSKLDNLHDSAIYSVDWNTKLNVIATGGGDNALNFCTPIQNILQLQSSFPDCHDGDINCVRWNPSLNHSLGNVLLTGSDDGILKIWTYSIDNVK